MSVTANMPQPLLPLCMILYYYYCFYGPSAFASREVAKMSSLIWWGFNEFADGSVFVLRLFEFSAAFGVSCSQIRNIFSVNRTSLMKCMLNLKLLLELTHSKHQEVQISQLRAHHGHFMHSSSVKDDNRNVIFFCYLY